MANPQGVGGGLSWLMGTNNNSEVKAPDADSYGYRGTDEQSFGNQAGDAQKRQGEQVHNNVADADYGQSQQARGSQGDALELMRQAASGQTQSVAQLQQQQGMQDAMKSQMAMAGAARGGPTSMALAQHSAAINAGNIQQDAVNGASQLRAQEMAQARGAYGQMSNDLRNTDLSSRGQSAQQAQYQAGLNAQQRAQNDQYGMGLLGLGQNASQFSQQGQTNANNADLQAQQINAGIAAQNATANAAAMKGALGAASGGLSMLGGPSAPAGGGEAAGGSTGGGVGGAAAGAGGGVSGGAAALGGMFSDERLKQGIEPIGVSEGVQNASSRGGAETWTGHDERSPYLPQSSKEDPALAGLVAQGVRDASARPGAEAYLGGGDKRASEDNALAGLLESLGGRGAPAEGVQSASARQGGEAYLSPKRAEEDHALAGLLESLGGLGKGAPAQGVQDATARANGPYAMLDALQPVAYNYRPESGEDPNKRRYGIMAQDLERTPMGASLVQNTPMGKKLDLEQGQGVQLAALADIHKRLKAAGL